MPMLANVSIDLDGLGCYHSIHGLAANADPTLIYRTALPRFLELFSEHGIRATLFVITEDLQHEVVANAVRAAWEAGHEIASHSHTHPYNLRVFTVDHIHNELLQSENAIEKVIGRRPVGFRTPGYNVDTRLLRVLAERGYTYDSSVFPCPPYYAAKGMVMAGMKLAGKKSGSSMTHPAGLLAPLQPYRPSRWNFARPGDRKHSLPLWEIPMGIVPGARLPVIGTSLGALRPLLASALVRSMMPGQPTLQLEFHGIDLIDQHDEGVHPDLASRQPDLRRRWRLKRDAFSSAFATVGKRYKWATLDELTADLERRAGPIVTS